MHLARATQCSVVQGIGAYITKHTLTWIEQIVGMLLLDRAVDKAFTHSHTRAKAK